MDEEREEQQNALKQAKVFTQKEEYFGIPSKVFYNTVALPLIVGIAMGATILSLITFIVLLILLVVPMYHIHKNDPFAIKVWNRSFFRKHKRWCAGRSSVRKIQILEREV